VEAATELWGYLRRVRFVRFVAQSEAVTGWDGVGTGSVVVEAPAEGVLTFAESGVWRSAAGRESRFSNVFRWTLAGPELIRLEHLRLGPDRPVDLFDLAPEHGAWAAVQPHVCGQDCYQAEVRLGEARLCVRWQVTGPKKWERLDYEYGWQALN
jgi:hypothetical protein